MSVSSDNRQLHRISGAVREIVDTVFQDYFVKYIYFLVYITVTTWEGLFDTF